MRVCGVDAEDLAEMIAEIRRLDPKPGATFDAAPAPLVVPDLLMRRAPDGGWVLELNPETLPRVLVNRGFHARALVGARSREDRAFLAERLQSANWLVKSLEQRANTILKVAAEIVAGRTASSATASRICGPLILRDVADEVALHESTVSRVTANKHIATPRGTFELKYFFTTAIAGTWRRNAQRRGGAPPHPGADGRRGSGGDPVRRCDRGAAASGRRGHRPADRGQIPRGAADTQFGAAQAGEGRPGLNSHGAARVGTRGRPPPPAVRALLRREG